MLGFWQNPVDIFTCQQTRKTLPWKSRIMQGAISDKDFARPGHTQKTDEEKKGEVNALLHSCMKRINRHWSYQLFHNKIRTAKFNYDTQFHLISEMQEFVACHQQQSQTVVQVVNVTADLTSNVKQHISNIGSVAEAIVMQWSWPFEPLDGL